MTTNTYLIPLWIKLLYTAFMCVLVTIYWRDYGPTNFLYFCDVALFLTLAALWLESPLLASMPAIGILLVEILWTVDVVGGLFGRHITDMTKYMFDPGLWWVTRALSLFHLWLPVLLLWLMSRLGYDRRAFIAWTIVAWVLLVVCYFFMPAPPPPKDNPNLPVNINYVYGLSDDKAQTWMDPRLYFVCLFIALPALIYWPTHLILKMLFAAPIRSA